MTVTRRLARLEALAGDDGRYAEPPAPPAGGASTHSLWAGTPEERVQACGQDLELFGRVYCPERFEDETPAFHRELFALADELDANPGRGAALAAPRGHGKSTVLSFLLPLHRLVYQRKHFIVLLSDTHHQASLLVADLKQELEENPRLRTDFGDLVGSTKWTAEEFLTATGVRVLARGTGSKVRGIRNGPYRPDLVIGDDLEDDEHVQTAEQRDKAWAWFNGAVVPTLDPKRGTLIVVGTVLHFDSLLVRLLDMEDIYLTRRYQTPQADGTALWPERFPLEKLAALKRQIGTLAFNSEYLNSPIDDATQVFRPQWWKWYTRQDVLYDHTARRWTFRGDPLTLYQGIDPAISREPGADYFAHVTIGVTAHGDVLVILPFQDRLDFPAQVKKVIELYNRWRPRLIGIETTAYQRALKQQVLQQQQVPLRGLANTHVAPPPPPQQHAAGLSADADRHVRSLQAPRTAKQQRIMSRSLLAERGQLWLREALEDEDGKAVRELGGRRVHHTSVALYEQATQYPRSAHDHLLDALDNALQVAQSRGPRWGENWF